MRDYKGDLLNPGKGACPLRVQAIVCADGKSTVALISVDCTFLGRGEVLRIRDALRSRFGIPEDHICVAATHSHAAPATTASFLHGELPDPRYIDLLIDRTCMAVLQAIERMQPARFVAAAVPAPPVGVCRRRIGPEGQAYMVGAEPNESYVAENPISQELPFIVFEDLSGKPLATLCAIACHNNMVGGTFSGDMFGRAGEALREKWGDIATVTLASPCGDISFLRPGGKKTYPNDRAAGKAIADTIITSYPTLDRRDCDTLTVRSVLRQIPDRTYDPAEFAYDNGRGSSAAAIEFHKTRYAPEEVAVRASGSTNCEVEFQVISFGNVAIVTNPAELFSVYGMKIIDASPFDVTIVASLANGYCGYVPTPEAFVHGGYETYRTVYTSRLAKDAGERIFKESVDLLLAVGAK